jgi:hypothetical protein
VQLAVDAADVSLDGVAGDIEDGCDLTQRTAGGEQPQHLQLLAREFFAERGSRPALRAGNAAGEYPGVGAAVDDVLHLAAGPRGRSGVADRLRDVGEREQGVCQLHRHRAAARQLDGPAGERRRRVERTSLGEDPRARDELELPSGRRRPRWSARLLRAEFLKIRKRRGLFISTVALTLAPMLVAYVVLAVLHATDPATHGSAGGLENFSGSMEVLTQLSAVAAILVGATLGAAISAPASFASSS